MNRKAAGFTLIEAMAVVAITAVTATIGCPAFSSVLQHQRVNTTMSLLSADMAMARSSAVMRHAQVVVCPRDAGNRCTAAQDWSRGWLVFADPDGNRQPDAGSDILRATDAPAGDSALLYLPSIRPFLRYQVDGRSAHTNLTVYVCAKQRYAGKIVVNNLGRVRTEHSRTDSPCPRA